MADLRDVYYHGVIVQIRKVINALGPERTEKGLTAFKDGDSTWAGCFFARAFEGELRLTGEHAVAQALNLTLLPIRTVYYTFDQASSSILSKDQLRTFISNIMDESFDPEVIALLRGLNVEIPEDKEINVCD